MRNRWDAFWAEAIGPRLLIVQHIRYAGGPLVTIMLVTNLTLGLLPVGFVIATSVLIGQVPEALSDGAGSTAWDDIITTLVIASALFIGQQIMALLQSALGERMQRQVDGYFNGRLIAASLGSTGIGPLEDQATLTVLREASRRLEANWFTAGHACAGLLALTARYARLVGFAALVGAVSTPVAGVAIFCATMIFRYGQRGGLRKHGRVWKTVADSEGASEYFRDVASDPAGAKEIRVFGLSGWLIDNYRRNYLCTIDAVWRSRRRHFLTPYFAYTAIGLLIGGAVLAFLARQAAAGSLTLTALALGLQSAVAALLLGEGYPESDVNTQFGMQAVRSLADFEQRMGQLPDDIDTRGMADADHLPQKEVSFRRVSFAYPGNGRMVLNDLDLTLRAGESTAVVGLNGAGKTTLVKLLTRLYEPTSGEMLVDGQDVRTFSVDSWRRQVAVIFQDFNRYELSAADNIAYGMIERAPDPAAVRTAATKAGIADALDALPRGFDTPLARHFRDGAELSGGQWQRLAIARVLYALDAGARVLVLDEPTSALDVRAETEFFTNFAKHTRGVTTLLISHRFSSVRHADRIVILENGCVSEDGTHDELIASDGRYAQLFRLQAERFEAGLDVEEDWSEVTGKLQ